MNEIEKKEIEEINKMELVMRQVYVKYEIVSLPLFAKELYDSGYRQCKDKVVLSREEYESVQKLYTYDKPMLDRIDCFIKEIKAQARKETAKEILKLVFKHIITLEVWEVLQHNTWLSSGGNFTANRHIWDLLLEPIAKRYGVEIKE